MNEVYAQKPLILGADANPITSTAADAPVGSGLPTNFFDKLNPVAKEYLMEQSLASNREALRREIIEKGKTELGDDDLTMYKEPRSNCTKCHGVGREGWDSATHEIIVCNCMRRGKLLDSTQDDFITISRLMSILSVKYPGYSREHVTPKSLRRVESKERKLAKKRRKNA